jgi:hypothetical protein
MAIQEAMTRLIDAERSLAPLEALEKELIERLRVLRAEIETAYAQRAQAQRALSAEIRDAAAAAPASSCAATPPDGKKAKLAKPAPSASPAPATAPAQRPPVERPFAASAAAQFDDLPF